jgi:hypothetical protein
MSSTAKPETLQATRRAVARIRSYGIDGPRPIEEIEALLAHGDDVDAALRVMLEDTSGDDLAAAIHLVSLMRRSAVADTVRAVAFATPAALQAKREAVDALRRCDVEPPADAVEKLAAIDAFTAAPDAEALAMLLEWPAAWREPALEAWLAAAGSEELSAVRIALGVEPGLDARLLDWIAAQGSPEAARVLQGFLAEADDKQRIKQVKKALHRLRAQGVVVDEPQSPGAEGGFSLAIESGALQDARAYVTSVDGSGARLVWVLWRAPSGGSRLLQAVVDDGVGVRDAEVATVTRQGFREYVEQMRQNPTVLLQQVPTETAATILAEAAARSEAAGKEVPADLRKWSELAGVSPAVAGEAPIYRHIGVDEVRDQPTLLDESMTLLRAPHFQSWAMEGEVIDAAAEEIHQAETSTLMVSDEQRQERMQDAIRNAVSASFDDDTRRRYRGRLEAMALMLWERGQHDEARQALAAAVGLTEIDDLFRKHAFARALAHRGVWLAYQDKQRELLAERQRSGIIQP